MKTTLITAFVVITTLAARSLVAQELDSVRVHASMIDVEAFLSGERNLPLSEPTVAIEPTFDEDVKSYTVRMPYDADGVTAGETRLPSRCGRRTGRVGGHCQVNRNPLFFDAKSIRANTTNQRLRWHVDQWNLHEIS